MLEGGGEEGGLDPADLRSAYKISARWRRADDRGDEEGGYPTAEADLAKYRAGMGFRRARNRAGASKQVNGKGEEANYPSNEGTGARPDWISTWHRPRVPNVK